MKAVRRAASDVDPTGAPRQGKAALGLCRSDTVSFHNFKSQIDRDSRGHSYLTIRGEILGYFFSREGFCSGCWPARAPVCDKTAPLRSCHHGQFS